MMSRRTIITAVGAGTVGLLWYTRAIQVAAFAAAASVGRSRRRPVIGPAQRAAEWAKASFPVLPGRAPSPAACVTYHPDYQGFEPQRVLESLVAARQLGVGWIRSDIRWNYLVPDGYHADVGAVAWYGDFLEAVRKCQLKSIVVLSTPPPSVLKQQPAEKLDSWSRFVEIVAQDLGARCDVFQLMNEVNNPLYGFLPPKETATALERGAAIVRAKLPAARIAINVSTDLWGWQDYLERLLRSFRASGGYRGSRSLPAHLDRRHPRAVVQDCRSRARNRRCALRLSLAGSSLGDNGDRVFDEFPGARRD